MAFDKQAVYFHCNVLPRYTSLAVAMHGVTCIYVNAPYVVALAILFVIIYAQHLHICKYYFDLLYLMGVLSTHISTLSNNAIYSYM